MVQSTMVYVVPRVKSETTTIKEHTFVATVVTVDQGAAARTALAILKLPLKGGHLVRLGGGGGSGSGGVGNGIAEGLCRGNGDRCRLGVGSAQGSSKGESSLGGGGGSGGNGGSGGGVDGVAVVVLVGGGGGGGGRQGTVPVVFPVGVQTLRKVVHALEPVVPGCLTALEAERLLALVAVHARKVGNVLELECAPRFRILRLQGDEHR